VQAHVANEGDVMPEPKKRGRGHCHGLELRRISTACSRVGWLESLRTDGEVIEGYAALAPSRLSGGGNALLL
jgi:hypothetical protein